ncbi:hypothetical protein PQX77_018387 [Marasmius sp. AFHP31]|nr:hypothetical protein PQX77_018387 [Marasmius sp. AFHP31]
MSPFYSLNPKTKIDSLSYIVGLVSSQAQTRPSRKDLQPCHLQPTPWTHKRKEKNLKSAYYDGEIEHGGEGTATISVAVYSYKKLLFRFPAAPFSPPWADYQSVADLIKNYSRQLERMSLLFAALSYRRQLDPGSTAPASPSCQETRTTVEIVLSCLSMIILCTWTSVRPNVPSVPRSGHWILVYWDKAAIFFTALLAPELIVLWSVRQWSAARKMAKAYKQYGWTITHAFFALMGGFALYDSEGKFLFHLWDERFCEHHKDEEGWDGFSKQQRKLEELDPHNHDQYKSLLEYCVATKLITMTEDEIESLGHTDLLAKTIAVFQTLQFITNCIARGISGLAITELEFFTLGFAALNLVSYLFWWYKPSGVRFPVRIMDKAKITSLEQPSVAQDKDEESDPALPGTDTRAMSSEGRASGILSAFMDRIRDDWPKWDHYNFGVKMLLLSLGVVMQTISYALGANSKDDQSQPERGNIFSAGIANDKEGPLPFTLMFSAAIILGIFHCIPIMLGYPDFPGHTVDHHLWTAFALSITGLPLGLWMAHVCDNHWDILAKDYYGPLIVTFTMFGVLSYPIARIALMVLAVKQLTDLPPSALQQVEWTTYIPHFGV